MDELINLEGFTISNVSCNSDKLFYKNEINSVYLDNVFKVVRMLRNRGYDKPIKIECDSIYDVSRSLFRYDTLGVVFGGSELSMRNLNSYLYRYQSIARDALYESCLSLSEKLNYIYITLAHIIETQKDKRKKMDMSFFSEEI